MLDPATPLILPALGPVCQTLAPIVETALRVVIGLALVPHGLRMCFGFFPNTGLPIRNRKMLAENFDRNGYRPGRLWAILTPLCELVGGPMLALGLFTRPVALPIFVLLALSTYEHGKKDGYFWNTLGLEYPLMWAVGAAYFVIHGGGIYSLDHLLLGRAF